MNAIFNRTNDDLNTWKAQMHQYEKGKRTKIPFGRSLPTIDRVTYSAVKTKQTAFNPVLQTFKHKQDEQSQNKHEQMNRVKSLFKHYKNTHKYEKKYDIVNLAGSDPNQQTQQINKKLGPVRNLYNIINNQKLSEHMYKGRQLNLPVQRQMVLLGNDKREYNILSGQYKQDNENKQQADLQQKDRQTLQKYWKTHGSYDPIFGKFYDPQKQQQFQEQLVKRMKEHGKDYEKKFPPSYVERQGFIYDYSKPLSANLQILDEKKANQKKRFQLKYVIDDEYSKRNQDYDNKKNEIIKNRVHNGRVMQQKAKQFDIITSKNYQPHRAEVLFNKNTVNTTWDKLMKTNNKIKSSGFQSVPES